MNALLADAVLVAHVAIAAFVVAVPPLVVVGHRRHWAWAGDLRVRAAHLVAIATIAAEAWAGIACPLTTLEASLRGTVAAEGFVEHWLHRLLFFSAPAWIFTAAYSLFALVVVATWWRLPPRRPVAMPATNAARRPIVASPGAPMDAVHR